jgi:hypothetical protein
MECILIEHTTTMVYDKQMNISVWITQKGRVYFVQNHHHHPEEAAAPQQVIAIAVYMIPLSHCFLSVVRSVHTVFFGTDPLVRNMFPWQRHIL